MNESPGNRRRNSGQRPAAHARDRKLDRASADYRTDRGCIQAECTSADDSGWEDPIALQFDTDFGADLGSVKERYEGLFRPND